MKLRTLTLSAALALSMCAVAQRQTDVLDRGIVAVQTQSGVLVSWRLPAEEYYDVTYNVYRDGTKLNDTPLTVSNYVDASGTTTSTYTVRAVVGDVEQADSKTASVWGNNWLEVQMDHGDLTSTYIPNDACVADVDGDGELEILLKFDNSSDASEGYTPQGHNGEYALMEVYKLDGTKLWWLNFGPNMADFQNNEQNIVAFDWDEDGRAEAIMRAADGTTIHTATGETIVIGDPTKNYRASSSSGQWFVHEGDEYLLYLNGATGEVYYQMEYPLRRLEDGETDLSAAWGDGYGHRSTKHFFGAPYLDGVHPSIFLARGIYTRHKMIALDVDKATHELSVRWRWNCSNSASPWYGNGYHNYGVADVDWDGRDEIVFGSMVIDDNGKGLSTTGLGHGDAQHCSDFDPFTHGQEIYACLEDRPGNNYRDATTSKIYYRCHSSRDDGRCMMANVSDDIFGAAGTSAYDDKVLNSITHKAQEGATKENIAQNFRIYWDDDLCEETFNGISTKNSNGVIYKYGVGKIETLTGSLTNNDTKSTPCFQGDIFGDWREEVIMRTANNNIRIYTTTYSTPWRIYNLWYDHQYRNAMVWQMCGYNQPPHTSYFLGKTEGITVPPPPLTTVGRTVVSAGGTIGSDLDGKHALVCHTGNANFSIEEGAQPSILTINTPTWVQGNDDNEDISTTTYTHTFAGGALSGATRLIKQGDGELVLPNVENTNSGETNVWAGQLTFDGTFKNSPLWLNRFAVLNTNGGQFLAGTKAEYASAINVGTNSTTASTATFSTLELGYGANVNLDIFADGTADQIVVDELIIGKLDWSEKVLPFTTPVFNITVHPTDGEARMPVGLYKVGEINKVSGSVSDIKLCCSSSDDKLRLVLKDKVLYIEVVATRQPTKIYWVGNESDTWSIVGDLNFVKADGEQTYFVNGDTVVFNDNATVKDIVIDETIYPAYVIFDNSTLDYTLSGDSIGGSAVLTKQGSAKLTINNQNNFTGGTNLLDGQIAVTTLANSDGDEFGALGNIASPINLSGGKLTTSGTVYCSHKINVLDSATINISGSLLLSRGISATSKTHYSKTGSGSLTLAEEVNGGAMHIVEGTVYATEYNSTMSTPPTVYLEGGTLSDVDNAGSYTSCYANIVVPSGKMGRWYLDSRCNYRGTLTGAGSVYVYTRGTARTEQSGDWSAFTGTVILGGDSPLGFTNANGLPNATLNITKEFATYIANFITSPKSTLRIGNLAGTGSLTSAGSGTNFIIGQLNKDVTFSGSISGCTITKTGSGIWTMTSPKTAVTSDVKVDGGILNLHMQNATEEDQTKPFFGTGHDVRVTGTGVLSGTKVTLASINVENGGTLMPGNGASTTHAYNISTTGSVYVNEGCNVIFNIRNGKNTETSRTYLTVGKTFGLYGNIKVELASNYKPAVGDSCVLWTSSAFGSGSTTQIELPELPAGLTWDTSRLLNKTGILRVVSTTAVRNVRRDTDDDPNAPIYDLRGIEVDKANLTPGLYIQNGKKILIK